MKFRNALEDLSISISVIVLFCYRDHAHSVWRIVLVKYKNNVAKIDFSERRYCCEAPQQNFEKKYMEAFLGPTDATDMVEVPQLY